MWATAKVNKTRKFMLCSVRRDVFAQLINRNSALKTDKVFKSFFWLRSVISALYEAFPELLARFFDRETLMQSVIPAGT